jgi:Na+-transporting methylmalonyl-CoA/oxaloacetate decarboxylase gamma subunit
MTTLLLILAGFGIAFIGLILFVAVVYFLAEL